LPSFFSAARVFQDGVHLQAAHAVFAFLADGGGGVHLGDAAVLVPTHGALREDVRALPFPFTQSARNYFFGVADAVDGGGVDPVDAELEGALNRADGITIVLRAPSKIPARAADGPGSVAYERDVHV
jgi:hypothetical protein